MTDRCVRALVGMAVVVATSSGLVVAQAPKQGQPTFRAATQLVEVDVAVTDASGRPIRGLSKDDFSIPGQIISTFQEVSHDFSADPARQALLRLPHDVADNRSAREANLLILVIDDRVPADRQARVAAIARQIIDELGPNAQVGLLAMSGRLAVEMTDDRSRVLAAIDRLRTTGAPRIAREGAVETVPCAFEVVEQAARLLAAQPAQRKALISISPYCGADVKGAVDSMTARADNPAEVAAVQMVDTMRRANVAFYALDPRGAVGFSLSHFATRNIMGPRPEAPPTVAFNEGSRRDGTLRPAARMEPSGGWTLRHFDPVILSQDNMRAVANATGGFAITATNDLDGGVRRLVDDFDHYYLLGFSPLDATSTSFHALRVLVDRPGAVLRYRRGYQLGGVKPSKNQLTTVTITGVAPVGDVLLRLFAMPMPTGAGAGRELVTIEVQAPRAALTEPDGSLRDDVSVTIAAVRPDELRVEKAFTFDRHVVMPKAYAVGASAELVTYQIVRGVPLPPASYQFRVSVKSAKLGKTGSVYLSADVPDHSSGGLDISGPLIGYADTTRHAEVLTLTDAGLLTFVPILDRTFSAADRLRIAYTIWRGDAVRAAVTTRVELIDVEGRTVVTASPETGRNASSVETTMALDGVAPGGYRLRVTAAAGSASAEREVGIAIR